jgi:GMP synthase (glutamine-hydrolysing)
MNDRPRVMLVQNSPRSGPGRLPAWLAERGVDVVMVSGPDLSHPSAEALPSSGGPPVARSGTPMDGLILLGGGFMPDDDAAHPFLRLERELVGDAVAAGVPVLGICLGAQLLALVTGGEVTATSGETERGSCSIELLPAASDDPLFAGLAGDGDLRMIENHKDSITALPPDAVHLATSAACRLQAFRVGTAAWGVQFHPEATATAVAGWDEAKLAAEGFDRAALLAQAEADAPRNTAQAQALAGAFSDIVRDTSSS